MGDNSSKDQLNVRAFFLRHVFADFHFLLYTAGFYSSQSTLPCSFFLTIWNCGIITWSSCRLVGLAGDAGPDRDTGIVAVYVILLGLKLFDWEGGILKVVWLGVDGNMRFCFPKQIKWALAFFGCP